MSVKPSFLFVPGAWHFPAYFSPVIRQLQNLGFHSAAVTNPSVNADPVPSSFQPDVDAVVGALEALLNSGNDVIVVMHSYGGMVGTEAVGKLVEKRKDARYRIKHLVYVTAFVPLEGHTIVSVVEDAIADRPAATYLDHQPSYYGLNSEAGEVFYHDVQEPLKSTYAALLGKQPIATFSSPTSVAGWRNIPSSYVYTKLDRPLPLPFQEFMVERASREEGDEGVKPFSGELGTIYLDSGHTPFLSMPEKVVDFLVEISKSLKKDQKN